MSSIAIVDTSVFCNILSVPNLHSDKDRALGELRAYLDDGFTLLLPLATIYETGNHIAQNGDGRQRRAAAEQFCGQVGLALSGKSPFVPTQIHQIDEIQGWLLSFPDHAMRGVGISDLSIIQIFEQQCRLNPFRRVFIWSYDDHLSSYDREV